MVKSRGPLAYEIIRDLRHRRFGWPSALPELIDNSVGNGAETVTVRIGSHGSKESIKTLDGKILDGRNRMNACSEAGVKPRYEKVEYFAVALAERGARITHKVAKELKEKHVADPEDAVDEDGPHQPPHQGVRRAGGHPEQR